MRFAPIAAVAAAIILGAGLAAAGAGSRGAGASPRRLAGPGIDRAARASVTDAPAADPGNVPYDGRFTFARIRFEATGGGRDFFGREDLKWDHDFPRAERNFLRILTEVSAIRPHVDAYMEGGNVFTLDDPELLKYPVAYLCEPGFWSPTDAEVAGLRAYLAKGGFIIFDDFFGSHWDNFEAQVRRVLPSSRPVPLDPTHPIFDSFFHIESLELGDGRRGVAQFYGIFEDNDTSGRLIAIVNYNTDIGDYWEWSDAGVVPVEVSNEAYKLGVNYVMYAMTH